MTKPCERVYTWGCSTDQMDRDNLEYNTDTHSDSDDTLLPHTPPDTSVWRQPIGAANIMTRQSVTDAVTGRGGNWHPI